MTMPLDFSSMVSSAQRGDVLKPVVYRRLASPTFTGFDVPVQGWSARDYDGRFHPSGQATWTLRQLYLYLTRPQLLSAELMELTGVLAVTSGSFWHEFFQNIFLDDGIAVPQRERRPGGLNPAEVVVRDDETNISGHADGMLTTGELLELKSINEFQILSIENEMILREKKPGYWAQAQDYQMVLDADATRFLNVHPAWPFPLTEFVVKADKKYQRDRREVYLRALEMAAQKPDGSYADDKSSIVLPTCCTPGSKKAEGCEVRLACPVGRYVR